MVQRNWKCFRCETLNCGDASKQNPEAIVWCKNDGVAQNLDPDQLAKLDDQHPENILWGFPLKDFVAREPVGKTPDGYIDPEGKMHSLEEYKETFGIDPEIYLNFIKRGSPLRVPGFECK